MKFLSIPILRLSIVSLILVNKVSKGEKNCEACDRNTEKRCVGGYLIFDETDQVCKLPTEEIKHSRRRDRIGIESLYLTSETIPTRTIEEWNDFCEINNKSPSKSEASTNFKHPDLCFKYILCYNSKEHEVQEDNGTVINTLMIEKEFACQRAWDFNYPEDYTGMLVYDPTYLDTPLWCVVPAKPHNMSQAAECLEDSPPTIWGSGWNKSEVENPCSQFENSSNITEIIAHPSNDCSKYLICKRNTDEDISLFPNITFVEAGDCGSCKYHKWNCPESLMYFDIERKECTLWSGLSSQRRTQCALGLPPVLSPLKKMEEESPELPAPETQSIEILR